MFRRLWNKSVFICMIQIVSILCASTLHGSHTSRTTPLSIELVSTKYWGLFAHNFCTSFVIVVLQWWPAILDRVCRFLGPVSPSYCSVFDCMRLCIPFSWYKPNWEDIPSQQGNPCATICGGTDHTTSRTCLVTNRLCPHNFVLAAFQVYRSLHSPPL